MSPSRIYTDSDDGVFSGVAVTGSVLKAEAALCFHAGDFVQLPVPIIQQLYHWDCGLACSRMVLQ